MKALVVLLPLLLVGCFSLQEVSLKDKDQWIPEAQKVLVNQEAEVTMTDGGIYDNSMTPDWTVLCTLPCEQSRKSLS